MQITRDDTMKNCAHLSGEQSYRDASPLAVCQETSNAHVFLKHCALTFCMAVDADEYNGVVPIGDDTWHDLSYVDQVRAVPTFKLLD